MSKSPKDWVRHTCKSSQLWFIFCLHMYMYMYIILLVCQGRLSSFDGNLQYSLHVSLKFRQAPCTNIAVSSAFFKIPYSLSYNKPHSTLPAVQVQDCWFQTITSITNSNHYFNDLFLKHILDATVFICVDFRGGGCRKARTNDSQRGASSVGPESYSGVCCALAVYFLCKSLSACILEWFYVFMYFRKFTMIEPEYLQT